MAVHLLEPGEDPATLARAAVAAGADSIGMAGGDGSLGAVAAVAVEHDLPFVCVPVGTRNHFAADVGLDRTAPLRALDAYGEETGRERRIDVAAVGERVFLNNVSLGSYATMVHEPGYREAKLATARATLPADLRGQPVPRPLSLRDPDDRLHTGPFLLLVANNVYDVRPPMRVGARQRLDAGVLQVSALYPGSEQGAALARLVAQLAVGRTPEEARWTQWTAASVRVDVQADRVPAGVDGEAVQLPAPLDFRSLPGVLRVRMPPPSEVQDGQPAAVQGDRTSLVDDRADRRRGVTGTRPEGAGEVRDAAGEVAGEGIRAALHRLDAELFRRTAARHDPVLDRVLPALSRAADNSVLWLGIAAGLAVAGRRRAALRAVASVAVASTTTNVAAKLHFRRVRPPLHTVPAARRVRRIPVTTSFPSGHSASAAAFATAVGLEVPALAAAGRPARRRCRLVAGVDRRPLPRRRRRRRRDRRARGRLDPPARPPPPLSHRSGRCL